MLDFAREGRSFARFHQPTAAVDEESLAISAAQGSLLNSVSSQRAFGGCDDARWVLRCSTNTHGQGRESGNRFGSAADQRR